jgi:hypothetical protein
MPEVSRLRQVGDSVLPRQPGGMASQASTPDAVRRAVVDSSLRESQSNFPKAWPGPLRSHAMRPHDCEWSGRFLEIAVPGPPAGGRRCSNAVS